MEIVNGTSHGGSAIFMGSLKTFTSHGSSNLMGGLNNLFGERTMTAPELEPDLPLEQTSSRVINSPSGPVFVHFEFGESF